MSEQDFNVSIRVHNARLLGRVRRQHKNAAEMARKFNLNALHLRDYMSFKRAPIAPDGSVRPEAFQICRALGCEFEDIWPEHLAEATMAKNVAEVVVSAEEVRAVIAGPEKTAEYRELIGSLCEAVTPRQLRAIEMHADGATLEEIGNELGGVGRERARQLVIKAQRRMRMRAASLGVDSFAKAIQ